MNSTHESFIFRFQIVIFGLKTKRNQWIDSFGMQKKIIWIFTTQFYFKFCYIHWNPSRFSCLHVYFGWWFFFHSYLKCEHGLFAQFWNFLLFKVENRTIDQLKNKYAALRKKCKKTFTTMHKEWRETGNPELSEETSQNLQADNYLLALRTRMGPAASGFASTHCMWIIFVILYLNLNFSFQFK